MVLISKAVVLVSAESFTSKKCLDPQTDQPKHYNNLLGTVEPSKAVISALKYQTAVFDWKLEFKFGNYVGLYLTRFHLQF